MKIGDFREIFTAEDRETADIDVASITADSRMVVPGALFFALPGSKTDGSAYAQEAVKRGAVAVIVGRDVRIDADGSAAVVSVDDPRRALALAAARFYGKQPETMVAVTGTSGKTSVASFVRQVWEHAGYQAASIGTTGVIAPGRNDYGSLTTPDPIAYHKMLKE